MEERMVHGSVPLMADGSNSSSTSHIGHKQLHPLVVVHRPQLYHTVRVPIEWDYQAVDNTWPLPLHSCVPLAVWQTFFVEVNRILAVAESGKSGLLIDAVPIFMIGTFVLAVLVVVIDDGFMWKEAPEGGRALIFSFMSFWWAMFSIMVVLLQRDWHQKQWRGQFQTLAERTSDALHRANGGAAMVTVHFRYDRTALPPHPGLIESMYFEFILYAADDVERGDTKAAN